MKYNRPIAKSKAFSMLVATVGLGMASTLMLDTRHDEGERLTAYRDLGGVWTICSGSTHGVSKGEVDTAEQCDARTATDLVIAVKGVERCVPALKDPARHNQLRAAVRFNNNTGRFCSGSPGKFMRLRQWRAGCDAMLRYIYVKGRKIRGLENRRRVEHGICTEGLG